MPLLITCHVQQWINKFGRKNKVNTVYNVQKDISTMTRNGLGEYNDLLLLTLIPRLPVQRETADNTYLC